MQYKFFALCFVFARLADAATIERWADTQLPFKAGLELWLDASHENPARESRQLPKIASGARVDIWHDASGYGRDLNQSLTTARPSLIVTNGASYVRFDGKDDFLAALNIGLSLTNATIFIVAAPHSNAGFFRGFLAANQAGRNDYTSGLNIDLGPGGSARFDSLNCEGNGFGGAVDLLTNVFDFGAFHTLTLFTEPGPSGTRFYIDGLRQGERSRTASTLAISEFTVGARCYSNDTEAPYTQGFLDGAIAEVLVYNRILSDAERREVETYLDAKRAKLPALADSASPNVLVAVSDPPPVQMLVPGFTVRELPVVLTNINNVKYRADGKLVASGYNGQIYLLSDTDGDGLEDKATVFWDKPTLRAPIGIALTPPGYARGDGLFVAAKGKLALIVDTNHDDVADQEITVATGWKELGHGVDALGVALDREGNVYFGLGCANFTDAYLIDKETGQSRYDLRNERGTILKVSADFSHREILCTGIRFPVALAFNRAGDLFSTDQEGATWLSNGNPFDELLHIQSGRHYGFPPRHPKHLPGVIDEPSVFDYTPQHQSTCGLNFNEPVNGGRIFGPDWWKGDALVTGYSRGKLYRTKLVKTEAGYLAQNQIIACLNMLTVDACVSPKGDLVVAVHSGAPDWGSGPNGTGKLYKVSYTGTNAAQPVLAWAASPTETRITFDRPLDPAQLRDLSKRTLITAGKYVAAGDRFESIRPGYQAVQNQLLAERSDLPVFSTTMTPDRRTLILTTPSRRSALNYAITLPGLGRPEKSAEGELRQIAAVDLNSDLHGVEVTWRGRSEKENWSGWLPHFNLDAARDLTIASADHATLWKQLASPGKLILRAQLDLWNMLRPSIQPGSKIDYTWPDEKVTLVLSSSTPFIARTLGDQVAANRGVEDRFELSLSHGPKEDRWLPLEVSLDTGRVEPKFEISWFTSEDPRRRALPLRRIILPWAVPENTTPPTEPAREIPELAGGNWLHGKRVFFSDQAACYKCHQVRGEGGKVGPDLSNLIQRDYASVLRDITEPNAAINPEHIAYNLELKNGDSITGIIQSDTPQKIMLADATGQNHAILKNQIGSMKPSTLSLMPEGLLKGLSLERQKDLLTFLLTSPLEPAALEIKGEPPPRPRAELDELLKLMPLPQSDSKPMRILLAAGPKDHGPSEHDYPLWQKRWAKLLGLADRVQVDTAFDWPKPAQFQNSDVIVFYSDNPGWSAERGPELDAFLDRGGGLVYLHYAVDGHNHAEELSQRIGLAWRGGASRFRHGPLDLQIEPLHPLARGLNKLDFIDESYWQLTGDPKNVNLLASGIEDGNARPLIWTREAGKGRIFVSIPGHYTWTFDDPIFRLLILRGIAWTAHEPIDRLSELTTIGARIGN